MKICVLDLEMNQPSNKIIQIGYVIANTKTRVCSIQRTIFVNPGEPIAEFITELTGITNDDVAGAVTLDIAYEQMVKECVDNGINKFGFQWGSGDIYCLNRELATLGVTPTLFTGRAFDVKAMYQAYAMFKPQGKTKCGLAKAMKELGLEFEGQQHNAASDAYNTWRVLEHLVDKMLLCDKIEKVMSEG